MSGGCIIHHGNEINQQKEIIREHELFEFFHYKRQKLFRASFEKKESGNKEKCFEDRNRDRISRMTVCFGVHHIDTPDGEKFQYIDPVITFL